MSRALVPMLTLLVPVLFCASLAAGTIWFVPATLARSLLGGGVPLAHEIVVEIRLPRAILALLVGAISGLSGAVLQGLLRNPLAEPGLLGVSAGASLGAVIAIYYGFAATFASDAPMDLAICVAMAVTLLLAIDRPGL